MTPISLNFPLFGTYVIAATVSILNVVISWLTVRGMRKGNPLAAGNPANASLDPTPTLARIRREWREDRQAMLLFLGAGLPVVVVMPAPFWLEECLLVAYLAAQVLCFFANLERLPRRLGMPPEARFAFRMMSLTMLAFIVACAFAAVAEALDDL